MKQRIIAMLLGCLLSWPATLAYLDLGPRLMETLRSDAYPGYGSQSLMSLTNILALADG